MNWIGLDPDRFDLLTHIENTTFTKPRPDYYRQIAARLGEDPARCLMVGNDPVNDLPAGKIDMRTYLTTDAAPIDYSSVSLAGEDNSQSEKPAADHIGPLAGLLPVLDEFI